MLGDTPPVRAVTKYAKSGELSIAYQTVGDGDDLVFVPGFMSHVELNWEYAFYSAMLERLASFTRLTVLDKRGTGLSDRSLGLGTLEERMDDLRAVMDDAGIERASLMGVSEGAALSVLFAATSPDRVSSLVLAGPYCPGFDPPPDEEREAFLAGIEAGWSSGDVLGFLIQHAPDDVVARAELARFERYCCTPAVAREIMRRNLEGDITSVLPTIAVPTLVVHQRGDPLVEFTHGAHYARQIPGAVFAPGDGDFHGSWRPSDYDETVDHVQRFLTGHAATPTSVDRVLSTVLFTDIAGSTDRAAAVGDARWRELLDSYEQAATEEVSRHGGVLVKSTGDGMLAHFDGPSRAVTCAHRLRERSNRFGLLTRAGAHTGEIELRDGDVGGMAVHIASRVAGLANAGEVLVSRTVKDLSVGSPVEFEDRGEHQLKGVSDAWQVFATTV